MTIPALYFSVLVASGLGLVFHLIRGGGVGRLLLYLAAAWVTFMAGHFVAEWLDWHLLRIGAINLFAALLASVVGLLTASILAGPERSRPRTSRRRRKG